MVTQRSLYTILVLVDQLREKVAECSEKWVLSVNGLCHTKPMVYIYTLECGNMIGFIQKTREYMEKAVGVMKWA